MKKMVKTVVRDAKEFVKDEKGGILTTENVGYVLFYGGLAALIGLGTTAAFRGKLGDIIGSITNMKAMDDEIDNTSGYGYTGTSDADTGITTSGVGN